MTKKNATYIALVFIMLADVIYFFSINGASSGLEVSTELGAKYFPNVLSIMLFALCLISLFQNFKRGNKDKLQIANFKYILATIAMTIAFITSWSLFDFFYISVFLFLAILFTMFRWMYGRRRSIAVGVVTALFVTVFVYVVFGLLMSESL